MVLTLLLSRVCGSKFTRGQNDPESEAHAWCWTIDGATGRRKTVVASQKLTKRLKHREKTSRGANDRVCLLISVPACVPPPPPGPETGTPLVWSGSCVGVHPFATANTRNFILSGRELF